MDTLSKGVIELLQFLLPGFVAAWVFYGFTSHPKPTQFERVVQALIFTLITQALVAVERVILFWIGDWWMSLGLWDENTELFWLVSTALLLGLSISWLAHNDLVHRAARRIGLTRRASFPSEWFEAFLANREYVVLHLRDERRLFGWPHIWPSDPQHGHFLMQRASWLATSEKPALEQAIELDLVVVDVRDVQWVEFIADREV